jgi:hypothetical protein
VKAYTHLRHLVLLLGGVGLGSGSGCDSATPAQSDGGGSSCPAACSAGTYCCKTTLTCERMKYDCRNLQGCPPGNELVYPDGPIMDESTCEPLPLQCTCRELELIQPGMIGRYSALAAHGGQLLASAYESEFGDLVLITAKIPALDSPTREIVDGIPNKAPTKGPSGWRGGVTDPGDDVGLDTDVAVTASGDPLVSYRDETNRTLKLARRAGGKWATHTVDAPQGEKEIVGRYTSLLLEGDKPAIAYLVLNLASAGGTFKSELRFAAASTAAPGSASDWSIAVIESAPLPCQNLCGPSEVCALNADGTSACRATSGTCTPACVADEACLGGVCQKILATTKVADVPKASGLWPSARATGTGPLVVYYDRVTGRLKAARPSGGTWKAAVIAGSGTEDVGAFCATATSASAKVHIAYQNVSQLSLHYLELDPASLSPSASETIDDGIRSDGSHPVGADSAIVVDPSGAVRVVYQDAQRVDLLGAQRSSPGNWTPKDTTDPDLGRRLLGGTKAHGFYSALVVEGGQVYGSSFFYDAQATPQGGLTFFKLP